VHPVRANAAGLHAPAARRGQARRGWGGALITRDYHFRVAGRNPSEVLFVAQDPTPLSAAGLEKCALSSSHNP
jgi:hypothetical protein